MSNYFQDMSFAYAQLPRITDRQFRAILNQYGVDMIHRQRNVEVEEGVPCECISNDDVFNQIDPDCQICGGTGIVSGDAYRDSSIRVVIQPDWTQGFQEQARLYGWPSLFERAMEVCYIRGDRTVKIGDWIIDQRDDGEEIEYEIYDKKPWRLGQGRSRPAKTIYQKLHLKRTEYAKSIEEQVKY